MIAGAPHKTIENYLNTLLQNSEDVFLVEVKVDAANNIKVFADADNGITIEKCVQINRALYKQIEADLLFENGNFSIEVSSPGVDEPLKLMRQYKKNISRKIEVHLTDDTIKQGKLISVNDEEIVIEEAQGKGRKVHQTINTSTSGGDKSSRETIKQTIILFNQIKHTKVLVTF